MYDFLLLFTLFLLYIPILSHSLFTLSLDFQLLSRDVISSFYDAVMNHLEFFLQTLQVDLEGLADRVKVRKGDL